MAAVRSERLTGRSALSVSSPVMRSAAITRTPGKSFIAAVTVCSAASDAMPAMSKVVAPTNTRGVLDIMTAPSPESTPKGTGKTFTDQPECSLGSTHTIPSRHRQPGVGCCGDGGAAEPCLPLGGRASAAVLTVSYTHLRAHETD